MAGGNIILKLRRDCREKDRDLRVKTHLNQVGLFYKAILTTFLLFTQQLGVSILKQVEWKDAIGALPASNYSPLYPDVAAVQDCFKMTRESVTVSSFSETLGS